MLRKLLVNDGRTDRELQLVERLLVGRDPECDLSDTNSLLSRRHAEFTAVAGDVSVRDLGSRNGVFVNGARVAEAGVRPGDVVRIGHFTIRYVEDTAASVAARQTDATIRFQAPFDPDETSLQRPTPAAVAAVVVAARPPAAARAPQSEISTRPALPPTAVVPSPAEVREALPAVAPERTMSVSFVFVRVAGAAVIGFLSAAAPLLILQFRAHAESADRQATTLVQWLSTEAAAAMQTNGAAGGAAAAADVVGRQPGVTAVAVLSMDGKVVAPRGRAGETVGAIAALGRRPADVRTFESAWSGPRLEAVGPIETGDGRRVGVAWVSYEPDVLAPMSLAPWLAIPAVVALLAAWVAAAGISRRVISTRRV